MKNIVTKSGYEINVGTQNGKFVYELYKNGELLEKDCTARINYSDLILDLAFELEQVKAELGSIYSGNSFPKIFLDDDHIDYTYKMATYHKNLRDEEKRKEVYNNAADYSSK